MNPNDGRVATGTDTGEFIQWGIVGYVALNRACYEKLQSSALCHDPHEDYLAVDFSNGSLFVVTTENLSKVCYQRIIKNAAITGIEYSSDASFLAVALDDNTLALFRSLDKLSPVTLMISQAQDDEQIEMATIPQDMKKWEYVGRRRSHWDRVTGPAFIGTGSQESPYRLFTVGRDR